MVGEIFDQKYWLNKQEEKDFLKKWSIDKIKDEVKWDLQKLEDTVIKNYHSENYDRVSQLRIDKIKNIVWNDFYNQNLKLKTGWSKWIAALQMLAMKCVNVMDIDGKNKIVEDMLESEYINSRAVDWVLGPNTLFVLKEISKTNLWWPVIEEWNGIVDEELLNKMTNICWEPKEEEKKQETKQETKQEEKKKTEKEEKKTEWFNPLDPNKQNNKIEQEDKKKIEQEENKKIEKEEKKTEWFNPLDPNKQDNKIKQEEKNIKAQDETIDNTFSEVFVITDIPNDKKPDAGKQLDLASGAKNDLLTAAAHPDLFDYDLKTDQFFPIVDKIQQYYKSQNLGEVQFMMPGATFEKGNILTGISIDHSQESRKSVGSDQDIFGPKANGKGILIVTKNGEMILSHASENPQIPADADVTTLTSVKRNGQFNPDANVFSHNHGHYVVEKQNWDKAILMLDDCTPEQKKTILSAEEYSRVLYCDTAGVQWQMDAYRIHKGDDLVYGNHNTGNILRNKKVPEQLIKWNMPSLLVVYLDPNKKENNTETEKEKTEEAKKQQEKSKELPEFTLQVLKNWVADDEWKKIFSWLNKNTFEKYGLNYEVIFARVNAIKNKDVKDKISDFLLKSDIKWMQKYVGMKERSEYEDNNADWKLDRRTLDRISNPMFGLSWTNLLSYPSVPSDLSDIYREFENKNLNKGRTFAIVSKMDYNMYVFSPSWSLISVHPVLLGKTKWDFKNESYKDPKNPKLSTTPGGMYTVDLRDQFKDQYAWPGDYVALFPDEWQYDIKNPKKFTVWFHTYFQNYDWDQARRDILKKSSWANRRKSNGCINTLTEWSIYDNLVLWSKLYVTKETN